jgi:uncharacterized OB-fold protein
MTSPIKIWRDQKNISDLLGKRGEIISWTIVRQPPAGFEAQAPYAMALVLLEDGQTIMAQIVDYSDKDLESGKKVATVVRREKIADNDGIIPYGIKVKFIR